MTSFSLTFKLFQSIIQIWELRLVNTKKKTITGQLDCILTA